MHARVLIRLYMRCAGVKFEGRPVSARFEKVDAYEALLADDSISTKV